MSKSSVLSMNVLLIFEIQPINGALLSKANFLSYALLFGLLTLIAPLQQYMHQCNLICLLALYLLSALPD